MFYIVSRDQGNGEFSIQTANDENEALDIVSVNRGIYIDSVAMSEDDLMLLIGVANNN
jgi:hypothetical protein|tara:strand:+ start:647 stop:820 length:174 start_codon:yes stop_codon:yes gene_type:complete